MLHRSLTLLALLALTASMHAADPELDRLCRFMTGSFSSAAQAEADTNYFDIRLEMKPIWPQREDARWLYVEQAVAWSLEKPYRQRVYRVSRNESGQLESAVYTLPEPLRFAGAWREDAPLASLGPDSLELREGCAILLQASEKGFQGSTHERDCSSDLRGASYATSIVHIDSLRLESWDRGFDEAGEQVWGAELGPYIFDKLTQSGTTPQEQAGSR